MSDLASEDRHIGDADLPAVFRAADTASVVAQKMYLRLILSDLALVLVSALTTSYAVSSTQWRAVLAVVGAVCFVCGLVLTGFIIRTGYDRRWFQARAVAESAKTMAWRYMACAEPYVTDLSDAAADELLCGELESVLHEHRAIAGALGGQAATGEQITEAMRGVRRSGVDVRKTVYLRDRLDHQRCWYSDKAEFNERRSDAWLYGIAVSQALGAAAAIALVRWPDLLFNGAGVLAALAAGFMAWLQLKQHQELSSSYGMAAHELGLIGARFHHVGSDEDLSVLVLDAENAISREHTMWVARRDVVG